ncbi:hypothetical protein [Pseudomaricurvus hydrocarbonicus]|nr:hypothetical protein [Aestuariicella hydrocarbonica]
MTFVSSSLPLGSLDLVRWVFSGALIPFRDERHRTIEPMTAS